MEKKPTNTPLYILQWLQVTVLTIGVGGIFLTIGSKSEILNTTSSDLGELKAIVHELIKSQVVAVVNDTKHQAALENLRERLSELEKRRN